MNNYGTHASDSNPFGGSSSDSNPFGGNSSNGGHAGIEAAQRQVRIKKTRKFSESIHPYDNRTINGLVGWGEKTTVFLADE